MNSVDLPPLPASVTAVASQLLDMGTEPPAAIVVADPEQEWSARLASWGRRHRAATVVVTDNAGDLVRATRLGVGGASWLPVSTQSLADASLAAASALALAPRMITSTEGALVAGSGAAGSRLEIASQFWIEWLGLVGCLDLLATVAVELQALPVIGDGPALLGALNPDVDPRAAIEASVHSRCPEVPPNVLLGAIADDSRRRPVAELPSGRHVGWWSFAASAPDDAVPRCGAGDGRLDWSPGAGGTSVVEVLTADAIAGVDASVVRMPRWMTLRLAPGSPECRLGLTMAREAECFGKTFWIPGVHAESLPCVLGWPGTLWVDGPVVPPDIVDS